MDYVLHWTISTVWNCKKGSESFARCIRMCLILEIYFQSLDRVQNDLCALYCTSIVEYCKAAVQQLLLNLSTSVSISASVYQCWKFNKEIRKAFQYFSALNNWCLPVYRSTFSFFGNRPHLVTSVSSEITADTVSARMPSDFTQHRLLWIVLAILDYDSLTVKINGFFHGFKVILIPFCPTF